MERTRVIHLRYRLLWLALPAALAVISCWGFTRRSRIHREHTGQVAAEFEVLTKRVKFKWKDKGTLTRQEAEQDLDELEWLLEHRFSYLERRGVDYRTALDSIRAALPQQMRRDVLALQLKKFMALFGDGHSSLGGPSLKTMCQGFLPFLVFEVQGRYVAALPDRSAWLDHEHPYIVALDDLDLERWLAVADQTVAQGSAQFRRLQQVRGLRYIEYLRRELGLAHSDRITVTLVAADGRKSTTVTKPLQAKCPFYGCWPSMESEPFARISPENIGYLRVGPWMSDEPDFQQALHAGMCELRRTQGLIIDVRGNGGGSRAPLRTLFPYFLDPNAPPQILNVGAYRLGHNRDILAARWMYPRDWSGWSADESRVIDGFARTFKPEWTLPPDKFSDWHYFLVGPSSDPHTYYYREPVVVLMNSANFSATDIFLGAFKGQPHVTLMGSASGGGSGRRQSWRLYHSHFRIDLSSMASYQRDGQLYEGRGIQPDIFIEPETTFYIGSTDETLKAAYDLLRGT